MSLRKAWLSPEVLDQIRLVAGSEVDEVCGIVTPNGQVMRLPNSSPTPSTAYEIRSADLVEAVAEYVEGVGGDMDGLDRSSFIIWHTHPSGFVGPSRGDMQNRLEGFQYAVVALPGGEVVKF